MEPHYLYIAQDADGFLKVGYSHNVFNRTMNQLNATPLISFGPYTKNQIEKLENEVLGSLSGLLKWDKNKGDGWTEFLNDKVSPIVVMGCVFVWIELLGLTIHKSVNYLNPKIENDARLAFKQKNANFTWADDQRCNEKHHRRNWITARAAELKKARARAKANGAFDLIRDKNGQIITALTNCPKRERMEEDLRNLQANLPRTSQFICSAHYYEL